MTDKEEKAIAQESVSLMRRENENGLLDWTWRRKEGMTARAMRLNEAGQAKERSNWSTSCSDTDSNILWSKDAGK